jgi:threonine/homoserine/homoserine lactone efflux protein
MLILNFAIASIFGFLGSLQPGSVNTVVLSEALTTNKSKGFHIAIGGSLVQGLGAYLVAKGINKSFEVPDLAFLLFSLISIGLGGYYLFKKKIPMPRSQTKNINNFGILKGISLAIINPQILPFWALIWVAFGINNNTTQNFNSFLFGFGAFVGTLSVLTALIVLSDRLSHVDLFMINKITGSILIFIGAITFIKWL